MKRPDDIAAVDSEPPRRARWLKQPKPRTDDVQQPKVRVVPSSSDASPAPESDAEAHPDAPVQAAEPELSPREARKRVRQSEAARRRYEKREIRRFSVSARQRRRRFVLSLVAIAACFALILLVLVSPPLRVQTVSVVGTQRLDATELTQSLESEMGRPIAFVTESSVANALSSFTLIKSVAVQAQLPSTLVVSITERTPLGVVPSKGKFTVIDDAGVAIETVSKRPGSLPLISVTRADLEDVGFRSVATVLASLPDDIRSKVTEIAAKTMDGVTLTTKSGLTIVWGDASDSAFKAQVLNAVLEAKPRATSIDVSAPNAPVYN